MTKAPPLDLAAERQKIAAMHEAKLKELQEAAVTDETARVELEAYLKVTAVARSAPAEVVTESTEDESRSDTENEMVRTVRASRPVAVAAAAVAAPAPPQVPAASVATANPVLPTPAAAPRQNLIARACARLAAVLLGR